MELTELPEKVRFSIYVLISLVLGVFFFESTCPWSQLVWLHVDIWDLTHFFLESIRLSPEGGFDISLFFLSLYDFPPAYSHNSH